jgi:hypothetical protein
MVIGEEFVTGGWFDEVYHITDLEAEIIETYQYIKVMEKVSITDPRRAKDWESESKGRGKIKLSIERYWYNKLVERIGEPEAAAKWKDEYIRLVWEQKGKECLERLRKVCINNEKVELEYNHKWLLSWDKELYDRVTR